MRLVILNACEGARTSSEDPYAGVAQTLVRQGIPAVLAMQFEIFEDAALTFAHEFYSALVDNYPVDAALSEARKAIFATGNDVEWGTPVLFTRAADGILFKRMHFVGYNLDRKFVRDETDFKTQEKVGIEKNEQLPNEEISEQIAHQKSEAIQVARDRERFERQQKFRTNSPPGIEKKRSKYKQQTKANQRRTFILVGVTLLLILCAIAGPSVWSFAFPPVPTDMPIVTMTSIPILIELYTPTTTSIPTSTFTSTPTAVISPTVTSMAPVDPDDFLIFYFDTVIKQRDLTKGWSLLTPDYQIEKAKGWETYTGYWSTTNRWNYSYLQVEYNRNGRALVLITYTIEYNTGSKPSFLEGVRYCLLWSDSINTWKIDLRDNCH